MRRIITLKNFSFFFLSLFVVLSFWIFSLLLPNIDLFYCLRHLRLQTKLKTMSHLKFPVDLLKSRVRFLTCQAPRTYAPVSVYLSSTDLLSFFFYCLMEIRLLFVLNIQRFTRSYSFSSRLFIPFYNVL